MSRISDYLTVGTPVVVPAKTAPANESRSTPTADPFWDELQVQAQALFGSILRAKGANGQPARVIGLTSFYRREGVSTIAAVLARTVAAQRRTLLIDANWVHSGLAEVFGVASAPGLFEVLSHSCQPEECIHDLASGVSLLTAGRRASVQNVSIPADHFHTLTQRLAESYDMIIVDLPSIRETPSTAELCSVLDGVALVVESERVHWQAGQRELIRLRQAGAHLLGAVLNKRRDYIPQWLYRVL